MISILLWPIFQIQFLKSVRDKPIVYGNFKQIAINSNFYLVMQQNTGFPFCCHLNLMFTFTVIQIKFKLFLKYAQNHN